MSGEALHRLTAFYAAAPTCQPAPSLAVRPSVTTSQGWPPGARSKDLVARTFDLAARVFHQSHCWP